MEYYYYFHSYDIWILGQNQGICALLGTELCVGGQGCLWGDCSPAGMTFSVCPTWVFLVLLRLGSQGRRPGPCLTSLRSPDPLLCKS